MKCQDCKCELAPWEVGAFDRCYSCECEHTRKQFKAHAETELALKQSQPAPPPMIDGRGREVPLYITTDQQGQPCAARPIAWLAVGILLGIIATLIERFC